MGACKLLVESISGEKQARNDNNALYSINQLFKNAHS